MSGPAEEVSNLASGDAAIRLLAGDDDRQTIILRIVVIAVCSAIATVERLTGLTGWVKSIYRIVCDMYPRTLLIMHSEHSRSSSSWVGRQAPRPIPAACLAPGTTPDPRATRRGQRSDGSRGSAMQAANRRQIPTAAST